MGTTVTGPLDAQVGVMFLDDLNRLYEARCKHRYMTMRQACGHSRIRHALVTGEIVEGSGADQPLLALVCDACPEGDRAKWMIAVKRPPYGVAQHSSFPGCLAAYDGEGTLYLLRDDPDPRIQRNLMSAQIAGRDIITRLSVEGLD